MAERIERQKNPLLDPAAGEYLPPGIDTIDRLFCIADWLAVHFQKRALYSLRTTYVLALLMGLMFLFYADLQPSRLLMFAFLLFFVTATAIQLWAKRQAWHRKYLDYRVLAEGLRVQVYWAAAGVTRDSVSKFAHDHFLQTQDPELGWIRNVMRVASTRSDSGPGGKPACVAFAIRQWIGDADGGQLGYFRKKRQERIARKRITDGLARLSLLVSVAVVALLVLAGGGMEAATRGSLMVVMGRRCCCSACARGPLTAPQKRSSSSSTTSCCGSSRTRAGASTMPTTTRSAGRSCGRSVALRSTSMRPMHRETGPRKKPNSGASEAEKVRGSPAA